MSSADPQPHTAIESSSLVAVIYGGTSSEREVSTQSGEAVLEALRSSAEISALKLHIEDIFIQPDGRWRWRGEVHTEEECISRLPSDCIVFNALHGGRGEGGDVQRALEKARIKYTGSGPEASALCMNKSAAREALSAAGLLCAEAQLITALPDEPGSLESLAEELQTLNKSGHGWFVKPNKGGSSAGVQKVNVGSELIPAIEAVLSGGDEALVEAAIPGVELSAGVCGPSHEDLIAFTPVEIQPRAAGWFDVTEKYDDENGATELCPPESVGDDVILELKQAALTAHRSTACAGYSRTDFIYSPEGQLFALEVNTLPGLTPRSLLPLEAARDGLSFPELCLKILSFSRAK